MEYSLYNNLNNFDNILYIGDEPKVCLSIIEDFNNRLNEIEYMYQDWFSGRTATNRHAKHDRLQYHIHYHFEGGIVIFKFKNDDELPYYIQRECFNACKNLVEEQLFYAS
ncbi:MAG: hypothetical protein JWQ84_494 [Mucilaginibacter sp.]|nr:hypothetical protein [Mucilaginibacter sp.]MDB5015662.1 hypothetical protein [Mucilaginibacter sp.]MDB5138557.1 hypothetical protein [Mucilaginibacter sp.]